MEHQHPGRPRRGLEPGDDAPAAHRLGIALVAERHRDRVPRGARHRAGIELPARRPGEQTGQRALEQRRDHLSLGVAEAHVELDHPRLARRQHDAAVEQAAERRPAPLHLGQHRRHHALGERALARGIDGRARGVGPHAAGVGPVVAVVGALVVARRRQQHEAAPVAHRHDRGLLALEELLDHHAPAAGPEAPRFEALGQERFGRLALAGHPHPLAGGQAIGLDDVGRREARQRRAGLLELGEGLGARGRHPGGAHDLLGEPLAGFEPGRGPAGPEHRHPARGQGVGDPGRKRRLGADHDQPDPLGDAVLGEGPGVELVDREAPQGRGEAVVSRRHEDLGGLGIAGETPGERMLAAPGAEDQNACAGRERREQVGHGSHSSHAPQGGSRPAARAALAFTCRRPAPRARA